VNVWAVLLIVVNDMPIQELATVLSGSGSSKTKGSRPAIPRLESAFTRACLLRFLRANKRFSPR
jgi:hypothetical protein